MRNRISAYAKTKDADQLRGNSEADQGLCFRYTDSTIPRFVSDLVGNPEDQFSQNEAHMQQAGVPMTRLNCLRQSYRTVCDPVASCKEYR